MKIGINVTLPQNVYYSEELCSYFLCMREDRQILQNPNLTLNQVHHDKTPSDANIFLKKKERLTLNSRITSFHPYVEYKRKN